MSRFFMVRAHDYTVNQTVITIASNLLSLTPYQDRSTMMTKIDRENNNYYH
jgi:hypothetical protein